MFRKTLLTLPVSAMLGMAAMVPTAALAFGPPPGPPPGLAGPPPGFGGPPPGLGGPPPGLGGPPHGLGGPSGGPPRAGLGGAPPRAGGGAPRFSRLDGPRGRGLQGNFRGFQGRSAALATRSASGYARYGYSRYGYGYGSGRYRYRPYGVYAYGSSYTLSNSGCYYISTYRRGAYRRALVCDRDYRDY